MEGAIRTLQEGAEDEEDEEGGEAAGIHVTGVWTLQIHVDGKTGEVSRIDVCADTLVSRAEIGGCRGCGNDGRGCAV